MALLVELGEFHLGCAKSKTSWSVCTSMRVVNNGPVFSPLHIDPLQHIRQQLAWVDCDRSFNLEILVCCGDEIDSGCAEHMPSLLEFWTKALVEAELWMQLDLNAALVNTSCSSGDCVRSHGSITLKLTRYWRNEPAAPTARHHRLLMPSSYSDITPPASVPNFHLQAVTISLQPLICGEKLDRRGAPLATQMLSDKGTIALLDASLRTSICPSPTRLKQGIKIIYDARIGTLAELAPAVWSRGYLQTVFEKSFLLPTTSRALLHFLSHKSVCKTLKGKLLQLVGEDSSGISVHTPQKLDGDFCGSTDPSTANSFHARLWTILQRSELCEAASRKLQPMSKPDDARSPKLEEEMLWDCRPTLIESSPILNSHSSTCSELSEANLDSFNDQNTDDASLMLCQVETHENCQIAEQRGGVLYQSFSEFSHETHYKRMTFSIESNTQSDDSASLELSVNDSSSSIIDEPMGDDHFGASDDEY